jgi:hypothetical protein
MTIPDAASDHTCWLTSAMLDESSRITAKPLRAVLGRSLPICLVFASPDVRSTPKADITFQRKICCDGPFRTQAPQQVAPYSIIETSSRFWA